MKPYRKYAKYYDLFRGEHDYDSDCDLLESLFPEAGLKVPLRILDMGCGTGEHSVRLLKRGHQVTGMDVSREMLGRAIDKCRKMKLHGDFHLQDIRSMELESKFDSAICLFGAFSRLHDDSDFSSFFEGLRKHLRKGGLFVFDFVNERGATGGHKDWKVAREGRLTVVRLDRAEMSGRILNDDHELYVMEGNQVLDHFVENHRLRTHSLQGILGMLKDQGFMPIYPKEKKWRRQPFGIKVAAVNQR